MSTIFNMIINCVVIIYSHIITYSHIYNIYSGLDKKNQKSNCTYLEC